MQANREETKSDKSQDLIRSSVGDAGAAEVKKHEKRRKKAHKRDKGETEHAFIAANTKRRTQSRSSSRSSDLSEEVTKTSETKPRAKKLGRKKKTTGIRDRHMESAISSDVNDGVNTCIIRSSSRSSSLSESSSALSSSTASSESSALSASSSSSSLQSRVPALRRPSSSSSSTTAFSWDPVAQPGLLESGVTSIPLVHNDSSTFELKRARAAVLGRPLEVPSDESLVSDAHGPFELRLTVDKNGPTGDSESAVTVQQFVKNADGGTMTAFTDHMAELEIMRHRAEKRERELRGLEVGEPVDNVRKLADLLATEYEDDENVGRFWKQAAPNDDTTVVSDGNSKTLPLLAAGFGAPLLAAGLGASTTSAKTTTAKSGTDNSTNARPTESDPAARGQIGATAVHAQHALAFSAYPTFTRYQMVNENGYVWIDIVGQAPSPEFFESFVADLTRDYDLHPAAVKDCISPLHLPKIERLKEKIFIITRYFDENCDKDAVTIGDMTNRVVFILSSRFVITMHRMDIRPFWNMRRKWNRKGRYYTERRLLNSLLDRILDTFEAGLLDSLDRLAVFEEDVFDPRSSLIRSVYIVKRRAQVLSRVLTMLAEVLYKYRKYTDQGSDPFAQDLLDTVNSMHNRAEEMHETSRSLIDMHIAIVSHNTNMSLSVLTRINVIFLPLTFVAGVYGMNFEIMPELKWEYGYVYVLTLLSAIALSIFVAFRCSGSL